MARITIAGGHGHVARLLGRRLADDGHEVVGMIRSEDQGDDLRDVGMVPLLFDLEAADVAAYAEAVADSDAVVFAAGAGPGSGAERKRTVDLGAAVKLRKAAEETGVRRYLLLSSMGTDDPPQDDDVFSVYLRAKAEADRDLAASDLDWTIVRPGGLTDDDPTGRVQLGRDVPRGEVPRADVAHVLAEALDRDDTVGRVIAVIGGDEPVEDAFDALDPATTLPPGRT